MKKVKTIIDAIILSIFGVEMNHIKKEDAQKHKKLLERNGMNLRAWVEDDYEPKGELESYLN